MYQSTAAFAFACDVLQGIEVVMRMCVTNLDFTSKLPAQS
jgi:hypothetical protein